MVKKKNSKFKVADLVMYSDKLPFPMPHLTVGLVIELIDLRQCIQDIIDDDDPDIYINDGFLKEWENYNKIRESLTTHAVDGDYLKEREYLLDRIMEEQEDFKYLYKVLWNDGVQYVEHPEDLTLFKLEELEEKEKED